MRTSFAPATLSLVSLLALGCAASTSSTCTPTGFVITASASDANTPDHTAPAPGNQELFRAGQGALSGPGCVTPQFIATVRAAWTTSDPKNISISSAADATNGLATCTGATTATVTATLTQGAFTESASAPLTCK